MRSYAACAQGVSHFPEVVKYFWDPGTVSGPAMQLSFLDAAAVHEVCGRLEVCKSRLCDWKIFDNSVNC